MNKLKGDCLLVVIQIFIVQIFPLVGGNSSSTRPAYKREYLYIHS